jgi:hypothetical protein
MTPIEGPLPPLLLLLPLLLLGSAVAGAVLGTGCGVAVGLAGVAVAAAGDAAMLAGAGMSTPFWNGTMVGGVAK